MTKRAGNLSVGKLARGLGICAVAALLTACPAPPRPAPTEKPAVPALPGKDLRGATVYDVNPQASKVHILVYRGGTLSRLAHNHVMSVANLQGEIWTHPTLARSGFDLAFPVGDLVIDDVQARQAAGSDFSSEVSQSDREGTRKNMLRAEVLNGERYPRISLRSVTVGGTAQKPEVSARITIRDASHDVAVKPTVAIDGSRITVSGEFDLLQTDFGIKPFSAALGALQVQDRLHVKFSVVGQK
jgi:hypothetical protein